MRAKSAMNGTHMRTRCDGRLGIKWFAVGRGILVLGCSCLVDCLLCVCVCACVIIFFVFWTDEVSARCGWQAACLQSDRRSYLSSSCAA